MLADRRGERSPDAQLPTGQGGRSATRRRLELAPRDQLRGNDIALYLVGSFTDDHEWGVAEVALDIVFGGIAVAAVDSDGVERDFHGYLRREQLGHPGLHVAPLAAVVFLCGVAGELSRRREFGGHVSQGVAYPLVLPDWLAQALPLLRIFQRVLESCTPHPQRPRSHLNTARFKAFHHLRESSARFVTEDRRGWYTAVVERQLATLPALVAQLREVARDGETLTMFD